VKPFKHHTLKEYLDRLADKAPVPGGGSAAALAGALGAGLMSMVAQYSVGKGATPAIEREIKKTFRETQRIRRRLLELVDLDAKAYLKLRESKNAPPSVRKAAVIRAREVPLEVCRLCYKAVDHAPFLVESGNKYLIADVAVACELLLSAFNGALVLSQYN